MPNPSLARPASSPSGAQQQGITVRQLPGLGGSFDLPLDIDDTGRVVGSSETPDGSAHPVLWPAGGGVTDLAPDLPPGATGSADGIGDNGRIVGFLSEELPTGAGPGVVTWSGSTVTTLSAPPATDDQAVDINNRNQILYRDGDRWFLWDDGVTIPAPDVEPGVPLQLVDINEWGLVVGTSVTPFGQGRRAYFWFPQIPALPPIALGTLGGTWSEAVAVNDLGQLVGHSQTANGNEHMFITSFADTRLTDLGHLGGDATISYGAAGGVTHRPINNLGHVVGYSRLPSGRWRAFLWRDGRMTDLGTLPGHNDSGAEGINDLDQVVANSALIVSGAPYDFGAFVWQDGRILDLEPLTGASVVLARAINNRGQVIGSSFLDGRAWLWTVPRIIWP